MLILCDQGSIYIFSFPQKNYFEQCHFGWLCWVIWVLLVMKKGITMSCNFEHWWEYIGGGTTGWASNYARCRHPSPWHCSQHHWLQSGEMDWQGTRLKNPMVFFEGEVTTKQGQTLVVTFSIWDVSFRGLWKKPWVFAFCSLLQVRREKAVYHTLNMLSIDVTRKCFVGEGWCPVASKPKVPFLLPKLLLISMTTFQGWWGEASGEIDFVAKGLSIDFKGISFEIGVHGWCEQIQDALQRAANDSNSQVNTIFQVLHTKESPPTYHITNKFTNAFQEIVDAYGYVYHASMVAVSIFFSP